MQGSPTGPRVRARLGFFYKTLGENSGFPEPAPNRPQQPHQNPGNLHRNPHMRVRVLSFVTPINL